MKTVNLISALVLISVLTFLGCKKDEGLTDGQKSNFIKYYGINAEGVDFKETSDGGYIMVGQAGGDIFLVKTDSYGNTMWTKSFGGIVSGKDDVANGIEIIPSGGYAIVGTTVDTSFRQNIEREVSKVHLLITDANGGFVTSRFLGDANKDDSEFGNGLTVAVNGNFVLACRRLNPISGETRGRAYEISGTDFSIVLDITEEVKDNTGRIVNMSYQSVIQKADGELVFSGSSDLESGVAKNTNGLLIKYLSLDQGQYQYGVFGAEEADQFYDLLELDNGNIVSVGLKTTGSANLFVIESSSTVSDEAVWESELEIGSGTSTGYCITKASDGYLVAGVSEISGKQKQMMLVKVGDDGSLVWSKDFGYVNADEAKAVLQTADGNIAIFGTASDERGNKSMCLIKTNSNGELIQ